MKSLVFSPSFVRKLNTLVRFLNGPPGNMFAAVKHPQVSKLILEHIGALFKQSGQKVHILHLVLTKEQNIPQQILSYCLENEPKSLVVLGVNSYAESFGKSSLLELNFARENLYELGIPILFWVPESTLGIVINQAKDLYSQRSRSTVVFEEETGLASKERTRTFEIRKEKRRPSTVQRINLLKSQIKEAQEQGNKILEWDLKIELARGFNDFEKWVEAENLLQEMIRKSVNFDLNLSYYTTANYILGLALQGQERFKEAETAFQKAAQTAWDNNLLIQWIESKSRLVPVLFIQKKLKRVQQEASKALKKFYSWPEDVQNLMWNFAGSLHYFLGRSYFEMNDLNKAYKEIFTSLSISNEHPGHDLETLSVLSNHLLGSVCAVQGRIHEAENHLKTALSISNEIDPQNVKDSVPILWDLADLHLASEEWGKAVNYLQSISILEIAPDQFPEEFIIQIESQYLLGLIGWPLGIKKEAAQHLEQAKQKLTLLDSTDPKVQDLIERVTTLQAEHDLSS